MKLDKIYQNKQTPLSPFCFDKKIANVFDNMIIRSVPLYLNTQDITAEIIKETYRYQGIIYDLGCSTGNTLYKVASHLNSSKLKLTGIDSSSDMIKKCIDNLNQYQLKGNINVICKNILDYSFKETEMIIMHYTLQFLPSNKKKDLVKKIYQALPKNGILILSEKLKYEKKIEPLYQKIYDNFKSKQGYSKLEISQKRKALENVLIPCTKKELENLFLDHKFSHIEILSQWINFSTFLIIK